MVERADFTNGGVERMAGVVRSRVSVRVESPGGGRAVVRTIAMDLWQEQILRENPSQSICGGVSGPKIPSVRGGNSLVNAPVKRERES